MAGTSRKKENKKETRVTESAGKNERTGSTAGRSRRKPAEEERRTKVKSSERKTSNAKTAEQKSVGKRNEAYAPEKESFMGTEVAIIVTFAVSVLLFLSNFGLCGAVGGVCRSVQLGIFGTVGYLAPVLLFTGICFYLSNRGNVRAVIKMASVAMVLLALCGLDQMMFGGGMKDGWTLGQYYTESAAEGTGGGFLGGLLCAGLCSLVGTVGAYLVLLAVLIIGAVCITEKSLVNLVKRGSGRAYAYAREDMSRRKELHEERKEERRRLREEQKVRGVDLEGADLRDNPPLMREFASGIPEGTVLSQAAGQRAEDSVKAEPASAQKEPEQPQKTELPVSEAVTEEPMKEKESPNPEDIFCGEIHLPERMPEPEEDDSFLYIRRDTRTVAELSGGEMGTAIKTGPGYRVVHTEIEREPIVQEPIVQEPVVREPVAQEPVSFEEDLDTALSEETDWIDTEEENRTEPEDAAADPWRENYEEAAEPEVWADSEEEELPKLWTGSATGTEKKNVVTTSGKVIPDLTVSEQIERKNEEEKQALKEYVFPPLTLLKRGEANRGGYSEQEYKETAIKLQQTLKNFGVGVTVTNISCGPTVTRYELHPEQGVKVSKIVALADDIKLNLAAADIRIEAPIPGKAAVGIEVPNKENSAVLLRDLLESDAFKRHDSKLAFAVGKDIGGQVVVSDIAKMPHLLIAGATGSGKSVCINTLIMSVIYKARPDEVKLIMIDPKVVELSVYNGIPHLLIPVVTDPKKASGALNWAVSEMMERYAKFAKYGVRDLKGFNAKVDSIKDIDDDKKPEKLPQIIIIVDELADLMMVAPGEVEDAICRLAQLARAAGIHLVIATQRPSVNVITGVIKANIPSRIAFSVSSGVDSRTIIDMVGAEKLLGKGDMLFYPSGYQKPQRVQGAFVSDQEVSSVVEFLTEQGLTAQYRPDVESKISSASFGEAGAASNERDSYFVQAARFIIEKDKASIGMLQRMFKIGFNRAARIMDQLADAGVVGAEEGTKPRKVLMSMEQFENMIEQEGM